MFTNVILSVQAAQMELNLNHLHDDMIHVPPSCGERTPVFWPWMQCPKSMLVCLLLGLFLTLRTDAVHSFYTSVNFYQTTLCHTSTRYYYWSLQKFCTCCHETVRKPLTSDVDSGQWHVVKMKECIKYFIISSRFTPRRDASKICKTDIKWIPAFINEREYLY
jgi:hypothetical protein